MYGALRCRYSVAVDSSVLGAACDGYVHRYSELRDQHHEPGVFVLDLGTCVYRVRSLPLPLPLPWITLT